jgi:hypothetical protein
MKISKTYWIGLWRSRFGQISPKSELGRWIQLISSFDEVINIVEIGCWNGKGSSRRIIEGSKLSIKNLDKQIVGLEANIDMYKQARRNLRKFHNYSVIWGSIVGVKQLDDQDLNPLEVEWFKKDVISLQHCPNVISEMPEKIDMLILDGGEFSTYSEFRMLYSRISGWVILDDTLVRKNRKVLNQLLKDDSFNVVRNSLKRNGFAIFQKSTRQNE